MRILVALSGGIDSSVTAHLLAEQGHELIGVRFTLWNDPLAPAMAQVLPSKCCNAQTAARTAAVAKSLGIPLHIVDLEKEFKQEVVDPFLEGYRAGRTPNPCIRCNRTIKFGHLLRIAEEFECDAMATGHYARTATERLSDGTIRHLLLEAVDAQKDQSYYLYGLTQSQLSRVLFPLGTLLKQEVYRLAVHYKVPFDRHYKESQDLCFFPEKTPKEFLKRYLAETLAPGDVVRRDGTVVGRHAGLAMYTVGQKRGLGIGGLRVPLEVVSKDGSGNRLIVADEGTERISRIALEQLTWVSWRPEKTAGERFSCRLRSLSDRCEGSLSYDGGAGVFTFDSPVGPQAEGQSLVLYRGEEVVGGGVMTHPVSA